MVKISEANRRNAAALILQGKLTTGPEVSKFLKELNPEIDSDAQETNLTKSKTSIRTILYETRDGRSDEYTSALIQLEELSADNMDVVNKFDSLSGYDQKRFIEKDLCTELNILKANIETVGYYKFFNWWVRELELGRADPEAKSKQIEKKKQKDTQKEQIKLEKDADEIHNIMRNYANAATDTTDRSLAVSCLDYALSGRADVDFSPSGVRRDGHQNVRSDIEQIHDTWIYKIKYPSKHTTHEYNKISLFEPALTNCLLDLVYSADKQEIKAKELYIGDYKLIAQKIRPISVIMLPYIHHIKGYTRNIQKAQLGHNNNNTIDEYLVQFDIKNNANLVPKRCVFLDEKGIIFDSDIGNVDDSIDYEVEFAKLDVQEEQIKLKRKELILEQLQFKRQKL
jgi:hypothetical protein